METAKIQVSTTPEFNKSIKEVAAKAAVGAIVGVVVTQLATYMIHKTVQRFKRPVIVVNPDTTTEK